MYFLDIETNLCYYSHINIFYCLALLSIQNLGYSPGADREAKGLGGAPLRLKLY